MSKWKKRADERSHRQTSLANKIAAAVGSAVVGCLLLMVIVTASMTNSSMSATINSEFYGFASQNAIKVKSILNQASTTATILQDYLQQKYEDIGTSQITAAPVVSEDGETAEEPAAQTSAETIESQVYPGVYLQKDAKAMENFMLNVAWSMAGKNEDIVGVGVFFEPNAFDPAIKDYTVYVTEDQAKKHESQSYGAYSEYSQLVYYANAAESQKASFTSPYQDQGIMMVTASFPVVYNGKTMGVIVVDINVEHFSTLYSSNEKYPTMFVDVLMDDGTLVYDSESGGSEVVGQNIRDLSPADEYNTIMNGMKTGDEFQVTTKKSSGAKVVRFFKPIDAEGATWWAASALEQSDLRSATVNLVVWQVILAALATVLIVFLASYLLRKYIKPIDQVVDASNEMAKGNFDVKIIADSNDEIGNLCNSVASSMGTMNLVIGDLQEILDEVANGNFNPRASVEYPGSFNKVREALKTLVVDLSQTMTEINGVSEMVSANADNISNGAQAITQGATDQASSVEELQATITEISGEVDKSAENARTANEMAKEVNDGLQTSNRDMQEVVSAMDLINESSLQIGTIIKTITDIASQTNILALNAAIEAARAGEAGKGFAVVASSVGDLAAQSAAAAKNTNELIQNTIDAVQKGKTMVDATAGRLTESVDKTQTLANNIQEISTASDRQATALSQIVQAAEQIANVVQQNTAMAEESSASSEELAAQAQRLKELIGKFKMYQP